MSPPWLEPRTAYVHIPFCGHHCGYCDFAVTAGQDHLVESYLNALELELRTLGTPRRVETLFIGGGTPTYLTEGHLQRLLTFLTEWLPPYGGRWLEWSIESTPESLTAEKARLLAAAGVTRVSIGVQSFHPPVLAVLDRRHSADQIPEAIAAVRAAGMDLSLDLIFAAPGSTLAGWQRDIRTALEFSPDHVSTYGLTYEKGTPMWKDRAAGRVRAISEDNELAMYEAAIDLLSGAGFEHYEISNFARPGKRCRHNERYWANEAYFGFGVGAARYVNGSRELNVRNTSDYIRRVMTGEGPVFQSEMLTPLDRAFETMAVQLRRSDGITRQTFRDQTGCSLDELCGPKMAVAAAEGLLADDGDRVWLTRSGKSVADGVIETLMSSGRPGDR